MTEGQRDPDLHTSITLRPRPKFTHRNSTDNNNNPPDIELQSLPGYNEANDPYSLRSGLKSADEIALVKANTSRKRTAGCTPKDAWKSRKLEAFYETQNENIERLLKPVDDHVREAKEKVDGDALQFKIAVHGSFVVCSCHSPPFLTKICGDTSEVGNTGADRQSAGKHLPSRPPTLRRHRLGLPLPLHNNGRRHLRPLIQPDPHPL